MSITKEEIVGTKIINEILSSNIVKSEYDTESKIMIAEFKNGTRYQYLDVPHQIYTQFRMAPSQGSFFNTKIAKTFKYQKIN
jgi:hypothetical protein